MGHPGSQANVQQKAANLGTRMLAVLATQVNQKKAELGHGSQPRLGQKKAEPGAPSSISTSS